MAGDEYQYDVFLSFRGPDTRMNFTDFLYKGLTDAGIRVFRDEYELPVGEGSMTGLIEAIKQSKVLIPIISRDYASSEFRLTELVQILECRKTMGAIIPIFYEVEPSDVRHQRNSIEESFLKHEKNGVDSATIQKWKLALQEIGSLMGFETAKVHNGRHSKLIDDLIPIVQRRLKESPSSIPSSKMAGDEYQYDVFLSFRGPDTRMNFTDFLYKGLTDAGMRVFRYDDELPVGEGIMTRLIEAIKQSKVLIPIISRDYASSKLCLTELVQILECWKTMGRAIIPIFYEVEPSDVRHQRNSIEKCFLKHKRNGVDSVTIQKWKQAFRVITVITGFKMANPNGPHSKLIDEQLMPIVLDLLKKDPLIVTNKLVGVDHHVQEIMRKLGVVHRNGQVIRICGGDVRVLGIYGIGGVGKSTIAKVVYNQIYYHFQCYSYLKEIRESSRNDRILSLQSQLISDLRKQRVGFTCSDDAMVVLTEQFRDKQVLILLDNMEDVDLLNVVVGDLSWFGPGSRIIVTSRKSDILLEFKEAETYEVEQMEEDKALQLFSKWAFGRDSPSEGFESLSRGIISAIGHLPPALMKTGSYLFGKSECIWKETLEKLKDALHEKVELVLKELPSSSTLPSPKLAEYVYENEVFLSFKEPDKHMGFTGFLYKSLTDAGIHVFRAKDEDELSVGEDIMPALFEAIKRSKVLIPIISRDYVSSKKCLRELVQILDYRQMRQAIIPIFYEIKISDVRFRRNSIEKSFLEHERNGADRETIKKWKLALAKITELRGFETAKIDGPHSKLIDEQLIPIVLDLLKKDQPTVTKYLVGVDHHVQEIMRKLGVVYHDGQVIEICGSDVRVLGIYGIGGVGKSTVAKVVYNQLYNHFQCYSYLKEIRESSRNDMILSLQNRLISDLLKQSVRFACSDDAMVVLAEQFHDKQVLILLDDVEDVDLIDGVVGKLNWFGPGSRIIVTSRKSDILLAFKEAETYEIEPMEQDEALQLFSKWAFGRDSPSKGFESLSSDIILASRRLPLALEKIGLSLFGKSESTWENTLERLRDAPDAKVEPLLKVSYDALEKNPCNLVATIEHVIGIDNQVKDVIKLLEIEDDKVEVCIVGIHGTSGIGKTTLAKAVYDRLSSCFDSCSFLAEIGETTQNVGGIQLVQTKLICDILERDYDVASFKGGIKFFLDVLGNIKALIVLDDVEEQSQLNDLVGHQLEWFGSGSRIIVTTEHPEILQNYDSRVRVHCYKVNEMDNDSALKLFRKHALGTHGSIPGYLEIGKRMVKATGQIPFFIEVIGSLLRGKTREEWWKLEDLIKPWKEISRKDSWEISKICYDSLDEMQKQIFWDIAWFANGVDSRIASYMWLDRDVLPSYHVLMPLAKIGEDNILRMHKLLKCLSKTIDQEETKDPGRRRRQHRHVTDLGVINGKEGMEEVEALCFDLKNHHHIVTKTDFESMPNIRFLKLDYASMTGDFTNVFPKLRWLRWQGCLSDFKATEFSLTELEILDLSWSKVTKDWGGWRLIKMEQLKVLNLTGCTGLLLSPTFSSFPNLEILILERCSRLVHLDPSVGGLKRLLCLNLKSCTELNRLPAELAALKALEELLIDETSLRGIPLGGDSRELETLSASYCLSSSLPEGVGKLVFQLRRLSLRNCHWIQKLPESIGQAGTPLEELDISGTGISELPDSFCNLQRLRVSKMDYCFISKFPSFIWHLDSLEEIHASSCRNLEGEIPEDIRQLISLRILRLPYSAISWIPPEIKHLSKLETLDVLHCDMLSKLPALLPSGLVNVCI